MGDFARRLVEYETSGNGFSRANLPAAFDVCEKLRPQLATLMGKEGYRALVARALALAGAEIPWLRAVQVKADGSLAGLEELQAQSDPDELFEGRVALVARLLGLLVAFIGEKLMLRLVCEVWPQVPLDDLDFGHGDENEKTK